MRAGDLYSNDGQLKSVAHSIEQAARISRIGIICCAWSALRPHS
jgi:hypothetical protein